MFEQEKNNSYRKKNASSASTFIGVFLIFAAFGVYNIFVSAISDGVDAVAAEIETTEAKITEISETIATYDAAKAEIENAGEVELGDSLNKIPERMYQDRVILNMLKLAADHDVEMNSLTFGKGSFGAIGSLRINSSFAGNYKDLIDFLQDVEGNERLMKVNSVTIQMGKESILDAKRVNFSVSMEVFYQTNN